MLLYHVKTDPLWRGTPHRTFSEVLMKLPRFLSSLFGLFTSTTTGSDPVPSNESAAPAVEPKAEPLQNLDWMLPASEPQKLELAGKQVGEVVDDYLWYELGDVRRLTDDEVAAIKAKFFVGGNAGFGDIELHRSSVLPGDRTVLRLRGRLYFHLSLELRGRYCALYQVGHSGGFLDMPTPGSVSFHKYWNEGVKMAPVSSSAPS